MNDQKTAVPKLNARQKRRIESIVATKHKLNARARGIVSVSADATDVKGLLEEMQKTFHEFKAERDLELDDIKKNLADVVRADKVDRINGEITKLQDAIDATNELLAAVQIGAGSGDGVDPDVKAHTDAFMSWFRKGQGEESLRDLEVKAAISTDSDPDGGYTVPEEMQSAIDRVLGTVSAVRNISGQITIGTDVYKKLHNIAGTSSGWVGEREARPETNTPQLVALEFPVMELYAMPASTQRALDDSRINIANWLADEVSTEFAEQEGTAFITGDGVNKPRGLLSYPTVADASWSWGNVGFSVTGVAADINDGSNNGVDAMIDLVYALKSGYLSNARFLMNRVLVGKIRKLKTLGGEANYLWQPPVQAGEPSTVLGYPLSVDDNMPNVGANAFPIAFGDFRRSYLIVDRFGIRVLRDPFTSKPNVLFYTTKRVGGGVSNFESYKLLKCST